MRAAQRLALPTVAVFQTGAAGFAARQGLGAFRPLIWRVAKDPRRGGPDAGAIATDPPSASEPGVEPARTVAARVDIARFNSANRDDALRRVLAPNGEVIVGYVGLLSREKRVHLHAALADIPYPSGSRRRRTGRGVVAQAAAERHVYRAQAGP